MDLFQRLTNFSGPKYYVNIFKGILQTIFFCRDMHKVILPLCRLDKNIFVVNTFKGDSFHDKGVVGWCDGAG